METQGWPMFAARRGEGSVWAVVGWEWRSAAGGRRAVGVEIGTELGGAPAVELGDGMAFTPDYDSARLIARREQ